MEKQTLRNRNAKEKMKPVFFNQQQNTKLVSTYFPVHLQMIPLVALGWICHHHFPCFSCLFFCLSFCSFLKSIRQPPVLPWKYTLAAPASQSTLLYTPPNNSCSEDKQIQHNLSYPWSTTNFGFGSLIYMKSN